MHSVVVEHVWLAAWAVYSLVGVVEHMYSNIDKVVDTGSSGTQQGMETGAAVTSPGHRTSSGLVMEVLVRIGVG